jgi:hypothetical protein
MLLLLQGETEELEQKINQFRVCRNGLTGLLDMGWTMVMTAFKEPGKVHAKMGTKGILSNKGKIYEEVYASLDFFFTELKEQGTPFATRIIREETGLTTRDHDNPDDVALPPHLSKHRCYANWCWERGWKVQKRSKAKTIYKQIDEHELHPYDDDEDVPLWPEGFEAKQIVTWAVFLHYWKRNFPNIHTRKKGADTCTYYLLLTNQLRSSQNWRNTVEEEEEEEEVGATETVALLDEIESAESTLVKAKAHVQQY